MSKNRVKLPRSYSKKLFSRSSGRVSPRDSMFSVAYTTRGGIRL